MTAALSEARRLLPGALVLAAAVAAAVGAAAGRHYPAAGFPLLLLDAIRAWVNEGLLAGLAFVVLFVLLRRLPLGRGAGARLLLPAALAAAPVVAAAGHRFNRYLGIRPGQLWGAYGATRNLAFLALCLAVLLLAVAALRRWLRQAAPGWRAGAVLAAAVLLLNGAVAAGLRGGGGDAARPDVLLLLVDALRADHLGAYGYPRPTTPALDALAADGVVFTEAVAASTFTKTSIASLLTGRHPYRHGVYWGSLETAPGAVVADLLGEEETTLAERLRERGYLTTAWVQNSHLRRFMGFAQGFVDYRDQQGGIARIHRLVFPWLAGPGRRFPYFAYLHYIDLHDPYRPPPPYDALFGAGGDAYAGVDLARWGAFLADVREGRRRLSPAEVERLRDLYDGQLRYVDDHVGRLLARLRQLDLYQGSLIVLTSDHGDAFYEHGFIAHSTTPYEELVRVPLIVKLPGGRFAGRRVAEPVRLVDVVPTVLDVLGIGGPEPGMDGCSLLPLVEAGGGGGRRDPACRVAVIEIAEDGGYPSVAIRDGGWKYIHHENRGDELYHLARDPHERRNLLAAPSGAAAPELPPEVSAVADDLRRQALAVVAQRRDREQIELDRDTLDELRALGYVQ